MSELTEQRTPDPRAGAAGCTTFGLTTATAEDFNTISSPGLPTPSDTSQQSQPSSLHTPLPRSPTALEASTPDDSVSCALASAMMWEQGQGCEVSWISDEDSENDDGGDGGQNHAHRRRTLPSTADLDDYAEVDIFEDCELVCAG